jgi:predicted permease
MNKLLRRLGYLLRQRQIERDLSEEIDFHNKMSGDPREMGNLTQSREDARAVWIWPWLQSVWRDLAYGFRNLRREPGFTLIAVIALGVAIGLNTSLFTVFDAIALRPWPVKEPRRVVKILTTDPHAPPNTFGGIGVAEYRYLAQQSRSFSGLTLMLNGSVHFGFEAFGNPSHAMFVAADHFRVLGVGMRQGRGFLPEEDNVGAPEAVLVLSHALWRDHFGSDRQIAGKQIQVNDLPFTVVGVTPEQFTGTSAAREDVYFPMAAMTLLSPNPSAAQALLTKPDQCCGTAAGRLAPGASQEQAAAELEVLSRQFHSQHGLQHDVKFRLAPPTLFGPGQGGPSFSSMFIVMTLVMLLACANIGNLLLARAGARQREIQMRRSLGATRARIVRQLLTESILLSAGAVLLGLLVSWRLPAFVVAQVGEPAPFSLKPDAAVLAYTLALAGFACVCFGLAPALHGTRSDSAQSALRLRRFLLAAQVALSVILLVGAGMLLEGVRHARGQDPGFAIAGVSVVSLEFPARAYDTQRMRGYNAQLMETLKSVPELAPFGLTFREPLGRSQYRTSFRLPGESKDRMRSVEFQEIAAGYFDVLRIPIVAGRDLEFGDEGILLNETAARRYWPGESAVGKSLVIGETQREVVGVAKDTYSGDLDRIEPMLYQPFLGTKMPRVLIRSSVPGAAEAVTSIVSRIDPHVRTQVAPLSENIERQLTGIRVGATLAGALGIFALALATVGMFGVFAYAVQQRTKEIGIRMALGGRPVQVVCLVLGDSSRAAAIGLGAGFAGALAIARLTMSVLYGVGPMDARAYLSAGAVLVIAALAASYVPALRVTRVDPISALRHE